MDDIYRIFGVDQLFQPRLNLIQKLNGLVELAQRLNIGNGDIWLQWQTSISGENDRLIQENFALVAPDPATGNPLDIRGTPYKIATAFLQEPTDNFDLQLIERYRILLVLLLTTLSSPPVEPLDFTEIATQIRLSLKSKSKRLTLLLALPLPDKDHASYLNILKNHITSIKIRASSGVEHNFLSATQKLIDQAIAVTNDTPISPKIVSPKPSIKPWNGLSKESFFPDDNTENGTIRQFPPQTDVDGEPDEPVWIYLPPDDEETSQEEQDAQSRRSRYWLRHAANRSINDEAIFTPIERRVLMSHLHAHLSDTKAPKVSAIALLIALSYATGLPFNELMEKEISDQGTFTSDGIYRRTLPPVIGYSSNDDEHALPVFDLIELKLPPIIRQWFIVNQHHLKTPKTLENVLKLDAETVLTGIKKTLDKLRDKGRYRIKLSRVPVGLPAELSARIQNPVITYLLAGRPEQEMPILLYYQQPSPQMLQSAYQQAIQHLFAHA
jgi:hypothetical protein